MKKDAQISTDQMHLDIYKWQMKGDKKFKQKIEEFFLRSDFIKEIDSLKRRYGVQIKKYKGCSERILEVTRKYMPQDGGHTEFENMTHKDSLTIHDAMQAEYSLLTDYGIQTDTITLAKKYNLYPSIDWSNVITFAVFGKEDTAFNNVYAAHPGLTEQDGTTLNCKVYFQNNGLTGEKELVIQLNPTTSIQDIEDSWVTIKKFQKKLAQIYKEKRYYPKKNLSLATSIKTKGAEGKNDWEIEEELFGKKIRPFKREGEIRTKRRRNIVKKTKYRYKI